MEDSLTLRVDNPPFLVEAFLVEASFLVQAFHLAEMVSQSAPLVPPVPPLPVADGS